MSLARLILRGLRHDWRVNACIVLGLAVSGAVIAGSLLVGDSMAATLRRTALARLGTVTHVLLSPRPFDSALADRLALPGTVRAVLLSTGSVQHADEHRRVTDVSVIGVDPGFWRFFPPGDGPSPVDDGVLLNDALARDLGVSPGDELLLDLGRAAKMSGHVPFASKRREDTLRSWRVTVLGVVPDSAGGSFSLAGESGPPRNLFADRVRLASVMRLDGTANAVIVETDASDTTLPGAVRDAVRLVDHGLAIRRDDERGFVQLESTALLLTDRQLDAARAAADELGATASIVSVQLATRLKAVNPPGGELAYAMVAAFSDPPNLEARQGEPLTNESAGIWLNAWAAEDLGARIGQELEWTHLVPRDDGRFDEHSIRLRLRGIVRLSGVADDRRLVPDLDGLTDATRIDQWKAPFPIDFARITDRDEQYWDLHGPTPKAFVDLSTMQAVWRATANGRDGRFATAARFLKADLDPSAVERALLRHLSPGDGGLTFQPIREQRLAAASGPTDFGPLFVGLGLFLIVAGVAMAALLMRLLAEQRAVVSGILLATGWTSRQVAWWGRLEAGCLVVAGAVLGAAMGVGYAWSLLVAMDRHWIGPWNHAGLTLTITPRSLLLAMAVVLVTGLLSHGLSTWRVRHRPLLRLLAREPDGVGRSNGSPRWPRRAALAVLLWLVALTLVVLSWNDRAAALPFFLSAASTLAGAVIALWAILGRTRQRTGDLSLFMLAIRNAAVRPSHGLLLFGTLASACFVLVAVAAHRRDATRLDWRDRSSGAGGFYLRTTTSVPLRIDPTTPEGRALLGFDVEDERALAGTTIVAMRSPGGDEVSCLNLSRPLRPRLLGVPGSLIERNAFRVTTRTVPPDGNPWRTLLDRTDDDSIPVFGDAESVRWQLHLDLGDTLSFPADDGRLVRLRIVGLVHDSVFAGELLAAESQLRRITPRDDGWSMLLVAPDPGRADEVAELLRSRLDGFGVRVETAPALLARFAAVKNAYLSIFQTLGGLGLLLGAVGVPVLIARAMFERRGELALLAAIGFSRRRIARLLLYEHAGLLIAGMMSGVVAALLATAPSLRDAAADTDWRSMTALLGSVVLVGLLGSMLMIRVGLGRWPLRALQEE